MVFVSFDADLEIDLSPLRTDEGYSVTDDEGGHTYDFNVCGEVHSKCSASGIGKQHTGELSNVDT